MSELNLDRLRSVLDYSPSLGLFKWRVARGRSAAGSVAGYTNQHGYVCIGVDGAVYAAHRLAWFFTHGSWPEKQIDHINGDRSDNRIANLRVVDRCGNSQNRRAAHRDSSHGFLGASWNVQHKRWQAKIVAQKIRHHLGYFDTAESAHAAYMQAKQRLHINGG